MTHEEHDIMRSVEDRHWWYRGLRVVLEKLLASFRNRRPLLVLDAGCGTGGNTAKIKSLLPHAKLVCLDFSLHALRTTAERNLQTWLCQGDTNRLPFACDLFDLVFTGDVLSQRSVCPPAALKECLRILKPGGTLVLNLPALQILCGSHDSAVNQDKRFAKSEVQRLLHDAGFIDTKLCFWNTVLSVPLFFHRLWSRRKTTPSPNTPSDLAVPTGLFNGLLSAWIALESSVATSVPLPFGSSLFGITRKPLANS